jgi:hypothetical protein
MQKIDTIELTLSQLGYERTDSIIGYHITLSKRVASFRHYLAPSNAWRRLFEEQEGESSGSEAVLTTKKLYSNDSFFTHTSQYGETDATFELSYTAKEALTRFLSDEVSLYLKGFDREETKRPWLIRVILGKHSPIVFPRNILNHDLFSSEEGYAKILGMYLNKSLLMVNNDRDAVKRFAMLMEKANFKSPESLATIALDTKDSEIKSFLNFIQANEELGIAITDYKAAYNAYSLVDKQEFQD